MNIIIIILILLTDSENSRIAAIDELGKRYYSARKRVLHGDCSDIGFELFV